MGTAASGPGEPRWLEAALGELSERVSPWARTFVGMALRPKRFVAGWLVGSELPMNPLGFMAASVAALSIAAQVLIELGGEGRRTFFDQVASSAAPYLYYAALGLLAHGALRLFGSRRRWTSTLAVALWAGAAVPTAALVAAEGMVAVAHVVARTKTTGYVDASSLPPWANFATTACLFVAFGWFLVSFGRGLLGLHRVRGWVVALLIVLLLALTNIVAQFIRIPVLHLTLRHDARESSFSISN